MPLNYTVALPANGLPRAASNLAQLYIDVKTWANNHTNNTTPADQHDTAAITNHAALDATTPPGLSPASQHVYNNMLAYLLARTYKSGGVAADFLAGPPIDLTTVYNLLTNPTTGATTANTANAIVQRNATGAVSLGAVAINPNTAQVGISYIVPALMNANILQILDGGNSNANILTIDKNQVATFAKAVNAFSFSGNGAGLTALPGAQLTGTIPAATVPLRGLTADIIAPLSVTADGATMVVTVNFGSFVNSTGHRVSITNTNVTLASIATDRWACIYVNDDGTIPTPAYGTDATIGSCALPTGKQVITWAFIRANATLMTQNDDSTAAHGYLAGRALGGYAGWGTGSGGGAGSTLSYVTLNAEASLSGSATIASVLNGTSSLGQVLSQIKTGTNDGSMADLVNIFVQPDLGGRIAPTSTTQIAILAGAVGGVYPNNPIAVAIGGTSARIRTAVANVTGNVNDGLSGTRYLIADLSGAGPGWTLANAANLPSSPNVGAYQVLLGSVFYDASLPGFRMSSLNLGALQTIFSSQVALSGVTVSDLGSGYTVAATQTNYVSGSMNTKFFWVAQACWAQITNSVSGTMANGGACQFFARLTPAGGVATNYAEVDWNVITQVNSGGNEEWVSLPGNTYYTITQACTTTGTATASVTKGRVYVELKASYPGQVL